MSFLRTLLMFVFVFSLLGVGGSYANQYIVNLTGEQSLDIYTSSNESCKRALENAKNNFVRRTCPYCSIKWLSISNLKETIDSNPKVCKVSFTSEVIVSKETKDPSKRPLVSVSDTSVCYNATTTSGGKKVWNDRNDNFVGEAKYRGLDCGVKSKDVVFEWKKPFHDKSENSSFSHRECTLHNTKCNKMLKQVCNGNDFLYFHKSNKTYYNYVKELKANNVKCSFLSYYEEVLKSNFIQILSSKTNEELCDNKQTYNHLKAYSYLNNKFKNEQVKNEINKRSINCNQIYAKKWSNDYVCLMLDVNSKFLDEAKRRGLKCALKEQNKTVIASITKNSKPSISSAELENEKQKRISLQRKAEEEERKRKALEQRIAELEKKNKELQQPKKKQPAKPKSGSGSGFFISKLGHIITNQHVVNKCNKITIGDHIDKQVPAKLIEADRVNDLALLRTTNLKMASAETQSLIRKLSIQIVPLASGGLMRKSDVKGGEDVIVAGFPYGVMFSKEIKVTFGNVNSTKGIGDDSSQFQIQAPVQPGNSGGPIYDRYGNIVGVVVSQLNKFKLAKSIGSLPENVNFGIKASTVSQFLNSSGVITNWSKRTQKVSNEKIFEIASKQTVMVVCHR